MAISDIDLMVLEAQTAACLREKSEELMRELYATAVWELEWELGCYSII